MTRWKSNLLFAVLLLGWFWFALGDMSVAYFRRTLQHRDTSQCGFVSRVCYRADQPDRKYLVFVPHVPPPAGLKKYPVILFLNGRGETGDDGVSQIINNFGRPIWEFQETFPFIAVMPQCPPIVQWTEPEQTQMALDTLEEVLSDYPADRQRVSITGASAGGSAAIAIALQYPDRFAAVVPISAAPPVAPSLAAADCKSKKMSVWIAFNSGDHAGLVSQCRAFESELADRNCNYRCVAYDRPDHDAWNFAYRDPTLYRWLLRQRRDRSVEHNEHLASDRQSVPWHDGCIFEKNRVIEFDAMLTSPLRITLSPIEQTSQKESQVIKIASLDDCFEKHDSTETTDQLTPKNAGSMAFNSGSLLARGSIRVGQWNHVSLSRDSSGWRIELNGWPFAEGEIPESQEIRVRLASVAVRVNDSKRSVESELSTAIQQEAFEIRNVRHRTAMDRQQRPVGSVFFPGFDSGSRLKSALSESHRDSIPSESNATVASDVVSQLKTRASLASGRKIKWTVQSRLSAHPYSSELTLNADGFSAKSQRCWLGRDHDLPAGSLIENASVKFGRAVGLQFALDQPIAVPRIAFTRQVTTSGWVDSWQAGDCTATINHDPIRSDIISAVRLTDEEQIEYQLDTLHMQAAAMAMGGLEQPSIAANFERWEQLGKFEWVGDTLCELYRERIEGPFKERHFWADTEAGGLIRRYQGTTGLADDDVSFTRSSPLPSMLGNVMIEMDYDPTSLQPIGWYVVMCMTPEAPIVFFEYAKVTSLEP